MPSIGEAPAPNEVVEVSSDAKRFEAFIPIRSEDDKVAADTLRREVSEELDGEKDGGDLVSRVVASLHWDYEAGITTIFCDQWFVISAVAYDESFSTFVQCYRLEDGFVATWKAFADRASQAT